MRNSKVRRRIAAGKLRLRIRDLRNLGPRSEQMLAQVGIHNAEELRRRGAVPAFVALRQAQVTSSLNALWALVGALDPWPEGRDWREVAHGPERLALMLQAEVPDQAVKQPRRAGKTVAKARNSLANEAWAPGLPFDEGGAAASGAKRRRRLRRAP
jgi:DNA transformation protein and related proteins